MALTDVQQSGTPTFTTAHRARTGTAWLVVATIHMLMYLGFTHGKTLVHSVLPAMPIQLVDVPIEKSKLIEAAPSQPKINELTDIEPLAPTAPPSVPMGEDAPPTSIERTSATGEAPDTDQQTPITAATRLQVIHRVDPDYPAAARRAGEQGTVVLTISVDAQGHVTSATVARSSGSMALDDAALAAVQRWQFAARAGGTAQVNVPMTFRLQTVRF